MSSAMDDNFYKILGERHRAPKRKKIDSKENKKKLIATIFEPTISQSLCFNNNNSANARYIVIEGVCNNGTKEDVSKLNPFLVTKTIEGISTGIISFRVLRSGAFSILMKSKTEAEKIIEKLHKIGDRNVTCRDDEIANTTKGVMRATHLRYVDDADVLSGLQEKNPDVKAVRQFKRKEGDTWKPTGRFLLTFNNTVLPRSIIVLYEKINIEKWYPNPLRCRKCLALRHHEEKCQSPTKICRLCSMPDIENHVCNRRNYCISCKGDVGHTTMDLDCPTYKMEREICRMMVDRGVSGFQARRTWHQENPGFNTLVQNMKITGKSSCSKIINTNNTNFSNSINNNNLSFADAVKNVNTTQTVPLNTYDINEKTDTQTKQQIVQTQQTVQKQDTVKTHENKRHIKEQEAQVKDKIVEKEKNKKTRKETKKQKTDKNVVPKDEIITIGKTSEISNPGELETSEDLSKTIQRQQETTPKHTTSTHAQTSPTVQTKFPMNFTNSEAWNSLLSQSPGVLINELAQAVEQPQETPPTLSPCNSTHSRCVSPLEDELSESGDCKMDSV